MLYQKFKNKFQNHSIRFLATPPTTLPVYETAPSDIPNLTNAPITESAVEHVAAVTVISEKTNKTKSEKKTSANDAIRE
jgi:hypothetical protein